MTDRAAAQPRIRLVGDSALLIEFEPVIDPVVNARAISVAQALRQLEFEGVRDVLSTYRTVAVYFDPLITDLAALSAAAARATTVEAEVREGRLIEVPVTYGGDEGPDIARVAEWAAITPDEVIRRHAARTYRVFMLGFLPGFGYMGTVDQTIAAPRREAPRLRVPAGSVGIAGQQTAIYPRASPGGWQIIGRTGMSVFDPRAIPVGPVCIR